MSREKQIEEMAKVIARRAADFRNPNVAFMATAKKTATALFHTGYRKQSEGEWKRVEVDLGDGVKTHKFACTNCGFKKNTLKGNFCPNCGSKMKGGAE